jgi:uncharacterized membrane protein YkgB
MQRTVWEKIDAIDHAIAQFLRRHGHLFHRLSLGILFIWYGLLKPFGLETTSSLLAHTIWWGPPDTMVLVLGWWEVAIGLCLIIRPLVRVALALLVLRLPGIILAFVLHPEICFVHFPFAPTPEGQYLLKDLAIFFATAAIAGAVREKSSPEVRR